MKYLPIRDFDEVTNALNFDTLDCQVIGGCDVYTTKAAGSDKKLYKNIENSLETQYASLLSFSAGLPPSQAKEAGAALNLSRASPFGSLSQISSRRTFAYLIATLNASHPDYDFSHLLRPSDFQRERSIKKVMNTLDTTLYNLRPRDVFTSETNHRDALPAVPLTPPERQKWSPRMWQIVDKQMSLNDCNVYSYLPEDDPFVENDDEASLWSFNYFFFNKNRKRVCYIYLRGLSRLGSETPGGAKTPSSIVTIRPKRPASGAWSLSEEDTSRKRARFWLGDRADNAIVVGDDDDEVEEVRSTSDRENLEYAAVEEEDRIFERLSATASQSPCKERSRERSSSARRRKSKESTSTQAEELEAPTGSKEQTV